MKKVFLLGDSIRMGYDDFVRDLLRGTAEVFYPEDNGRFAGYTYVNIPQWKHLAGQPEEVNVVHWNSGHWDCAHFYRDSVLPAMAELREPVDKLEMLVDKDMWPMPSYGDMIFEV